MGTVHKNEAKPQHLTVIDGGTKKKKKGRPQWKPDLEEVRKLSRAGLTNDQQCTALGISRSTFYGHQADFMDFLDTIKKERARVISEVGNVLLQKALGGGITALIFYLKAQAGWRDRGEYSFEVIERKDPNDTTEVLQTLAIAIRKHSAQIAAENSKILEHPSK